MKNQCKQCMFYSETRAGFGECRRNPPVISSNGNMASIHNTQFPVIIDSAWCGELQVQKTRKTAMKNPEKSPVKNPEKSPVKNPEKSPVKNPPSAIPKAPKPSK